MVLKGIERKEMHARETRAVEKQKIPQILTVQRYPYHMDALLIMTESQTLKSTFVYVSEELTILKKPVDRRRAIIKANSPNFGKMPSF